MTFSFTITNYRSKPGENLYLTGSPSELGNYDPVRAIPLAYINGIWTGTVKFSSVYTNATYQYFSNIQQDPLVRSLPQPLDNYILYIKDDWAPPKSDPWYAKALEVIFPEFAASKSKLESKNFTISSFSATVAFRLYTVYPTRSAQIAGIFSQWAPLEMAYIGNRTWEILIEFNGTANVEFKFLAEYQWEAGANRTLGDLRGINLATHFFRYPELPLVKIAGIALPLFSINSKNKICADFGDLMDVGRFCRSVGYNAIYLLPLNDTFSSFPYSVASSFALSIIYLDITSIGAYAELQPFKATTAFDYEESRRYKEAAARAAFSRTNGEIARYRVRNWLKASQTVEFWLPAYCIFAMFAKKFGTHDFTAWGYHPALEALTSISEGFKKRQQTFQELFENAEYFFSAEECNELYFQAFVYYHLYDYLSKVSAKLFLDHVFLIGDLPIGVSRHSCDCWAYPELFSQRKVLGAPPDAFSENGQNWGFPVFLFEEDEKNGFLYTKMRFRMLDCYFKALRIDHILGWFRTWQIDREEADGDGRLGIFSPVHALYWRELEMRGISDRMRLLERQISVEALGCQPSDLEKFADLGIIERVDNILKMRCSARSALSLLKEAHLSAEEFRYYAALVQDINSNVCMLQDANYPQYDCHPVFYNMFDATACGSFKLLDAHTQEEIRQLSHEYYNHRQIELWRSNGRKNLAQIAKCTNQLIIGENLGFTGSYVADEMREHGIAGMWVLQLENEPQPAAIDNRQYASTGTHDCPSLRGFFATSSEHAKSVYQKLLKKPFRGTASASDVQQILRIIMQSNALLAIFPIQDILAGAPTQKADKDKECEDFQAERINDPSQPDWVWNYRMNRTFAELCDDAECVGFLRVLTKECGRWHE